MRFAPLLALTALLACARAQPSGWPSLAPLFAPPAAPARDPAGHRQLLRFDDGRPVRNAQDWAERRAQILAEWQEILGPWPPLLDRPAVQELWKQRAPGFVRHRLDLEVAPGRKSAAFLLVPDGKGPFPAVVDVFYYPEDCAGLKEDRRRQ